MTTARLPLTLIAAVARNGVIGHGGRMPWTLPGDLAHFRAETLGKPVLMGRKTYASIGKALPGRHLVLLSRDMGFAPQDVSVARDLDMAIRQADAIGRAHGAAEIMVAGGGELYAALMPVAMTLALTEVDLHPEGDTFFPPVDPRSWIEIDRMAALRRKGDDASYVFVRYCRVA